MAVEEKAVKMLWPIWSHRLGEKEGMEKTLLSVENGERKTLFRIKPQCVVQSALQRRRANSRKDLQAARGNSIRKVEAALPQRK